MHQCWLVADVSPGFRAALREIYTQTKEQRYSAHCTANVLDRLPKRMVPRANIMLHEIMNPLGQKSAGEELGQFVADYEAPYPKGAECLAGMEKSCSPSMEVESSVTFGDTSVEITTGAVAIHRR